jgi:diguanylate cyclase (GGDEF)-like protein
VTPPRSIRRETLWTVERYAGLAALCLHDADRLDGLLASGRLDGLTGCLNHRAIHSELNREIQLSARSGRPVSCCFIDLDHFKRVNDMHGHEYGSRVLAKVAAVLRDNLRLGDALGRYGGDEFVAVLPDTDQHTALLLAERLRVAVSEAVTIGSGERLGLSVGIGQSRSGTRTEELLSVADDALLTAKRAGGARVVASPV